MFAACNNSTIQPSAQEANQQSEQTIKPSLAPTIEVEQDSDTVLGAGIWFYYDADRILTEEDFAFLEPGMSLKEIVSVVGRQNGISGMNNLSPFYTLENGRLTLTFYPIFSSSFEYLLAASIQYSDGSRRNLLLD